LINRRAAVLVVTVLVLSGCAAEEHDIPPTDVSGLKVTGEQTFDPVFYAKLSPNGERMLYRGHDGTCVGGFDRVDPTCVDPAGDLGLAELSSAAWSPNGTHIALTDPLAVGEEPDLRVLDVASGEHRTLTEDGSGYFGLGAPIPDDAVVDVWPSWSPDGETIRFIRRQGSGLELMSIPASGGEPTTLRSLDGDVEQLWSVAWSADRVAWLIGPDDGPYVAWMAGIEDGEPVEVLRGDDVADLSFSSDGEYLLVDTYDVEDGPEPGAARVVAASGGTPVRVAAGDVVRPVWSPEGHAIAYVELPETLRVVGKPGAEPKELGRVAGLDGTSDQLHWGRSTLLVRTDEQLTALTVEG
jgi:dipeptidyl aminopeptidase/acylaminoacyl peptidase